mmetsp:Transcript_15689/g.17451  ORF Transcript_15689/g.17451 Transcript_15689/m.17451 type:complete len:82 (+) Transcript_15689:688-933(+)
METEIKVEFGIAGQAFANNQLGSNRVIVSSENNQAWRLKLEKKLVVGRLDFELPHSSMTSHSEFSGWRATESIRIREIKGK